MGRRTETAYQGRPRCDELAQHSEIAGSVVEVNAAVVPGSNAFLPGEAPPRQLGGESAEAIVPINDQYGEGLNLRK